MIGFSCKFVQKNFQCLRIVTESKYIVGFDENTHTCRCKPGRCLKRVAMPAKYSISSKFENVCLGTVEQQVQHVYF